jgi:protein-tyrosine-phosphatase
MTSILVVCTGNICRSPIAEGLLRAELDRRFGDGAPRVSSAGTAGWDGAPATPEGVQAAAELGVDIADHQARRVSGEMMREADLIVCMAADHRDRLTLQLPELEGRTFTLKELVRLLDPQPEAQADASPWTMAPRIARAHAMRQVDRADHLDEDIADPLGQPIEAYRAIAWELEQLTERLVVGLYGPAPGEAEADEPPRAAGA